MNDAEQTPATAAPETTSLCTADDPCTECARCVHATEKIQAADRILAIRDQIQDLLDDARSCYNEFIGDDARAERYVFAQIEEHLSKGNKYNTDLGDLAQEVRDASL